MATERQIAANRVNARKATGPKSRRGKIRSSKNAFKHGLSLPPLRDAHFKERSDAIALAIAQKNASEERLNAAYLAAEAYLALEIVRAVHRKIMNSAFVLLSEIKNVHEDAHVHPLESDDTGHFNELGALLRQLQRLDRYEERAQARWRKAVRLVDLETQ